MHSLVFNSMTDLLRISIFTSVALNNITFSPLYDGVYYEGLQKANGETKASDISHDFPFFLAISSTDDVLST